MKRLLWLALVGFVACAPLLAQEARLQVILDGQTANVSSLVFSPDGKTLASGNTYHTIKLWDVATARTTATLKGHTGTVHFVAFSPDGKTLASGSEDKTVRLWYVAAAKDIAKTLELERQFVNVKAKTGEGLGAIGRGEMIEALAIAQISALR